MLVTSRREMRDRFRLMGRLWSICHKGSDLRFQADDYFLGDFYLRNCRPIPLARADMDGNSRQN